MGSTTLSHCARIALVPIDDEGCVLVDHPLWMVNCPSFQTGLTGVFNVLASSAVIIEHLNTLRKVSESFSRRHGTTPLLDYLLQKLCCLLSGSRVFDVRVVICGDGRKWAPRDCGRDRRQCLGVFQCRLWIRLIAVQDLAFIFA
eukprot:scaffold15089_cov168-Amphora_coffeaeformis.AAC.12